MLARRGRRLSRARFQREQNHVADLDLEPIFVLPLLLQVHDRITGHESIVQMKPILSLHVQYPLCSLVRPVNDAVFATDVLVSGDRDNVRLHEGSFAAEFEVQRRGCWRTREHIIELLADQFQAAILTTAIRPQRW